MGPCRVVEVLPNYTCRVKHSGQTSVQTSVQSEQRLKLYHASPDAVGQAPPLLEPNRQSNHQGRATQPREVKIFVRKRPEQKQPSLLEQLEQQQQEWQQQQQQAPGPASPAVEDAPTHSMGEGRDPLPW